MLSGKDILSRQISRLCKEGGTMPRKGENIYHRKDGRWEGRYIKGRKPDGTPRFGFIYGKQYSEVKKRLIVIKSELYRKPDCLPIAYGSIKLCDWADYWLEGEIRPHVRPETYAGYRRNLDNHICPHMGGMAIADITPLQVQHLADSLSKTLAPSTLHGICRLLKSMFGAAAEKGLLRCTPYQNIKLPKSRCRSPRVLTQTEQRKLEEEIFSNNEPEYLLCLYMGLRVGELCALRWEDVDFENGILHIRHAVHRIPLGTEMSSTKLVLGVPKSEFSVRDIPLPAFLSAILMEKKIAEKGAPKDFLFKGTKTECRDPRTMQQKIARLCKKLDLIGVHMHTLRHTFATRCLENGIQYEVLSEFLGHSSPQITLRHYAHCTPETKRLNIERITPVSVHLTGKKG